MRIAKIIKNDVTNGEGISVSLWVQGCPHHCIGCHNPETWDFNEGKEILVDDLIEILKEYIINNGIIRNLSILGGEPLSLPHRSQISYLIVKLKKWCPSLKIYLWTGYTLEYLKHLNETSVNDILNNIDVLIDGPFIQKERNLKLHLRGSSNQKIYKMENI